MINNPSQLVGCGRNRFFHAQSGFHSAVINAQIGIASGQGLRANTQCGFQAIFAFPRVRRFYFAAGYIISRADGKPTGETFYVGKAGNVGAYFGKNRESSHDIDTIDFRQVGSHHAMQLGTQVKGRRILGLLFEIAKQGYTIYTSVAIKSGVYGSLGIVPIFFVWLLVLWILFLAGFELYFYLENKKFDGSGSFLANEQLSGKLLRDILDLVFERQNLDFYEILRELSVPRPGLFRHLEQLQKMKLVGLSRNRGRFKYFSIGPVEEARAALKSYTDENEYMSLRLTKLGYSRV